MNKFLDKIKKYFYRQDICYYDYPLGVKGYRFPDRYLFEDAMRMGVVKREKEFRGNYFFRYKYTLSKKGKVTLLICMSELLEYYDSVGNPKIHSAAGDGSDGTYKCMPIMYKYDKEI